MESPFFLILSLEPRLACHSSRDWLSLFSLMKKVNKKIKAAFLYAISP
jgi:hypothetical protein